MRTSSSRFGFMESRPNSSATYGPQASTPPTPTKLIAFRIHGVSAEFAGEISHLGFPHAPPDQLIALRIHGVTPEYIEGLRSKGMQNLTLDQLISLRIHDID